MAPRTAENRARQAVQDGREKDVYRKKEKLKGAHRGQLGKQGRTRRKGEKQKRATARGNGKEKDNSRGKKAKTCSERKLGPREKTGNGGGLGEGRNSPHCQYEANWKKKKGSVTRGREHNATDGCGTNEREGKAAGGDKKKNKIHSQETEMKKKERNRGSKGGGRKRPPPSKRMGEKKNGKNNA